MFHLISAYEELNLSLVDKKVLTPSELHIVECIGNKEQITSKEIGEELNITKGAVS
ncbi:MarR family transcriptional regulator [Vagococcus fluvialis]|nr:MarR family transcriptional regulator [Vagococcus fluvialis]NKC59119.1 MarR family transcriptional regulator [Vagococcus fluvialis]NKD49875.1 MarR family transcriptional regulator [Vagococcus fluvialis]